MPYTRELAVTDRMTRADPGTSDEPSVERALETAPWVH